MKKCSFCGKPSDKVEKLIVGNNDIAICNECVDLCNEIILEDKITKTVKRVLAKGYNISIEEK